MSIHIYKGLPPSFQSTQARIMEGWGTRYVLSWRRVPEIGEACLQAWTVARQRQLFEMASKWRTVWQLVLYRNLRRGTCIHTRDLHSCLQPMPRRSRRKWWTGCLTYVYYMYGQCTIGLECCVYRAPTETIGQVLAWSKPHSLNLYKAKHDEIAREVQRARILYLLGKKEYRGKTLNVIENGVEKWPATGPFALTKQCQEESPMYWYGTNEIKYVTSSK